MYLIDQLVNDKEEIFPGKWAIAKPLSTPIPKRIIGAFKVLTGEALPVKFASDYVRK